MSSLVRRGRVENLLRRSWTGSPNPSLRVLSAAYGAVADFRNIAWTVGLASPIRAPVPIISVGGVTIGGSGKTPISAALARHLADSGSRVAVLTAGLADETALHSKWNPDVPVFSGRDRGDLARQAADRGATVAVLDSGFQHRRLERDLDILAISADFCPNRLRLPAGPFRERWTEIGRADAAIVVRRTASVQEASHLATVLSHTFPGVHIALACIIPGSIAPVSEAAHAATVPSPHLAVAGVMWPDSFFHAVRQLGLHPDNWLALSDHAVLDDMTIATIVELADSGGVVCTGKDAVKLVAALPITVPVWQVVETVVWETGGMDLLDAATHVAEMGMERRTRAG